MGNDLKDRLTSKKNKLRRVEDIDKLKEKVPVLHQLIELNEVTESYIKDLMPRHSKTINDLVSCSNNFFLSQMKLFILNKIYNTVLEIKKRCRSSLK